MGHAPLLRRAVRSKPGQWVVITSRGARAVSPSLAFVARQMLTPGAHAYRLRGSRRVVTVRHRTRDIAILNEIFGGTAGIHCYEPPEPVASLLLNRESPTIMDLGANIGLFGIYAYTLWPEARITSYEPDPGNAELLLKTITANGLSERWVLRPEACSNRAGTLAFLSDRFSESRAAVTGESGTIDVPMADIFNEDHNVDLLKMDIEGGEWAILTDARLSQLGARALVLEWHSLGCPEPDPHAHVVELLANAGYRHTLVVGERREHTGVVWAWRDPPSWSPQ